MCAWGGGCGECGCRPQTVGVIVGVNRTGFRILDQHGSVQVRAGPLPFFPPPPRPPPSRPLLVIIISSCVIVSVFKSGRHSPMPLQPCS